MNFSFLTPVYFQNDRYTVGGKDVFDTLADLVEHFKRTGIEELSGTMVFLKQVKNIWTSEGLFHANINVLNVKQDVQQKH